jgi:hypothetical protein
MDRRSESISSSIVHRLSSVEWLTRPGSQQLGAKWVEVDGGVRGSQSLAKRANLKRGQQHPLRASLKKAVRSAPDSVGLASGKAEAAGVGQPFMEAEVEAGCQMLEVSLN